MKFVWSEWGQFLQRALPHSSSVQVGRSLVRTYQAVSTASIDILWQKVVNLDDVSWHPLLTSTNAPNGLTAKPGVIYKGFSWLFPLPIHIFVERVDHRELLSVRVYTVPGLEERVTYRVESTLCGTCISYSVTLRGWLSPLAWSLIRPHAARVASALAQAAEQANLQALSGTRRPTRPSQDLLGILGLVWGITTMEGVARHWV
ncbi:MAG: SRPBCC family protein [Cyanobacteria bacterium P01_A01_bin.123]